MKELEGGLGGCAIRNIKGNFLRSVTGYTKEESRRVNKSCVVVRWTPVASVRTVFIASVLNHESEVLNKHECAQQFLKVW